MLIKKFISLFFISLGMEVVIQLLDETTPYQIKFPDVECEVGSGGGEWVKGGKTGQRSVNLTNGVTVKAPHHVESGDKVTIRLPEIRIL
jgi:hypothetical protein